jgi:hypothetical protein
MRSGTPSLGSVSIRSRHGAWRDSRTSRATQCGVTPSATLDATFSNATVDISRAKYESRHEAWCDQKGYFLEF